jgi:cyclase
MLTKRIIPCLDVKNGSVVKGVRFKNHEVVGSILDLAKKYNDEGADELVFYDIGASTYDGTVSKEWVKLIAEVINIPFCVAGGIKRLKRCKRNSK